MILPLWWYNFYLFLPCDANRIAIVVAKLVQDLPRRKRSGNAIASTTASSMGFDQSKSTSTATGLFNNLTFLPSVAEERKSNPESVIAKLQKLRKTCGSD